MFLRSCLALLSLASFATAPPSWLGPDDLQSGSLDPEFLAAQREITLDPALLAPSPQPFILGIETLDFAPSPAEPNWILRIERAVASTNSMGEIASGDINLIDGNESYCLTLGRYLVRDFRGHPLDISLNGSFCFHPGNLHQDNIYQYILWLNFQWTEFPWSDHLRTKIGLGEGLSYVSDIPYSETLKRGGDDSIRLLNYLEFSLSFNMADLANLTRINRLLPNDNAAFLENAWLVGSLHHRSGGRGLFGEFKDEDGSKKPMTGGDNLFVLGVAVEF